MNELNNDVIYNISTFLELKEIIYLLSTNKQNNNPPTSDYLQKKIKEKKEYVLKNFPEFIIDTMDGIKTLIFAPILEFKDEYEGSTGYLDLIEVKDVCWPLMVGVDSYGRAFITFKLKIIHKNKLFFISNYSFTQLSIVIFQYEKKRCEFSNTKKSYVTSYQN